MPSTFLRVNGCITKQDEQPDSRQTSSITPCPALPIYFPVIASDAYNHTTHAFPHDMLR